MAALPLPDRQRRLALDVGEKRIGVAVSDPLGLLAFPLTVLTRQGEERDVAAIRRLGQEQEVGEVVVGLPRSLNGSIGREGERVKAFIAALRQGVEVPVVSWDERLTTVAAERRLKEASVGRQQRKERRDAAAAALLLQSYLDWKRASDEEAMD